MVRVTTTNPNPNPNARILTSTTLFRFLTLLSLSFLFLSLLHRRSNPRSPDPIYTAPCDYSDGEWVLDRRPVAARYDHTCREIFKGWNCAANRKPNSLRLLRWRWHPSRCPLPRLHPLSFLRRHRNTNIGFVGDSLNRNMFASLVCMLTGAGGEVKKWRPAGADRGFTFLRYNLTVAYHRTNLLVRYGGQPVLMEVHWNLLDISKVIEWTSMFPNIHGLRQLASTIFLYSIQDTGGGHLRNLIQFNHRCSFLRMECQ